MKKKIQKVKKAEQLPKITRTTQGLRDALFEELDKLRNGKSDPQKSNAVARTAASIIGTVKLEIEFKRLSLDLANARVRLPKSESVTLSESKN